MQAAFPPLRDTGGFELLRITGNTRSRDLCVIQSPDEGYSTQFLRNPATGIGQATLYVRPLQRSIDLEVCRKFLFIDVLIFNLVKLASQMLFSLVI